MSTRIMIVRHAEKPSYGRTSRGVAEDGGHDKHELTIRGWQRAGALVRFFAPLTPDSLHPLISQPRSIFAAAATERSPSLRSQHTVGPLADLLGLEIDNAYPEGAEVAVARAVLAAPAPVLISWHHKRIRALAHALAGAGLAVPPVWPDGRFDVVWVLDQAEPGGAWVFSQVVQRLLPGDSEAPIGDDDDPG